jgi:hypothetical protein
MTLDKWEDLATKIGDEINLKAHKLGMPSPTNWPKYIELINAYIKEMNEITNIYNSENNIKGEK